jgi:hypothetical protein
MSTGVRAAAAATAGAALTTLIVITVHPAPVTAVIGTTPLAVILWAVFAAGAWLVLKLPGRWAVALIVIGGIAVQLAALSAGPQGSDDLYRYIWDGKVQAAGIDPYHYAPAAPQLVSLRDPFLWGAHTPHCVPAGLRLDNSTQLATPGCTRINRPIVPTIYPPVAEAYFLAVYDLSPAGSGTKPIQAAAALCAVLVTLLLLYGLPRLGRDPRLAVLWAWCPTVAFEGGNNAHVDIVAAGFTAGALTLLARPGSPGRLAGAGSAAGPLRRFGWASRAARPLAGGAMLALAIWTKVTPVLVAPAVLRRRPVAVISAGIAATMIVYLPHVLAVGSGVIGFLPGYLHEEGYANGTRFLLVGMLVPGKWGFLAAFVILGGVALAVLLRGDPDRPWRGALVMTGAALAVTTPPFPWYALLLILLVAFDGRAEWLAFAVVRYLAVSSPLPGVHVPVLDIERAGYGLALAVVTVTALIRWRRISGVVQPAPAAIPAASPAPVPVPR